jgi:hypothetical protein
MTATFGRSVELLVLTLVFAGCAAKRLPPGTPPPEYETRELPAWTGNGSDAGSPTPAPSEPPPVANEAAGAPVPTEQPKTEPVPVDAGSGPSPDAGVR